MSAPYYCHDPEHEEHLDECDSDGEADSSEGNASHDDGDVVDGGSDEIDAGLLAGRDGAPTMQFGVASLDERSAPRDDGDGGNATKRARTEPKRRGAVLGKVMSPSKFERLIGKPWKFKTHTGVLRSGPDKRNHGLALVLDESASPPVHRLHCTLCDRPVPRKIGQHLGREKHWDKYNLLLRGHIVAATTEGGGNQWVPTANPVGTRKGGEFDDVVDKLRNYQGGRFRPPAVDHDFASLLDILPLRWSEALTRIGMERVSDLSLDLGRRPCCRIDGRRKVLCEDDPCHVVEDQDVGEVAANLRDFRDGDRVGVDGELHRIGCIRNKRSEIIGLTVRVGRHVEGTADMIRDLLEESDKNILFLGERGSGKTTVLRDAARILSQKGNVFIVDAVNEIAGEGDIPHPCVGDARRVTANPSRGGRADSIIECLQNHAPSIIVVDDIGNKKEVEAARRSKRRLVRNVASARGDLRSLIKNEEVRGLVGGLVTREPRSESGAEELGNARKKVTARANAPIFDVIVELGRAGFDEWHVVLDAATAVDDILRGKKYEVQKRLRCVDSGEISVKRKKK